MLLALVYWLLPLTVFFPPATLTVQFAAAPNTSSQRAPKLDFTSTNFANVLAQEGAAGTYVYSNAQFAVQAAVAASLTESQILPVSAPALNSTWLLSFPAPALSCALVGSDFHDNVTNNILEAMNYTNCYNSYCQNNYTLRSSSLGPVDGATLSLFVAALPGMTSTTNVEDCFDESTNAYTDWALRQVVNVTVAQCMLQNVSYIANFTYADGVQSVNVSTNSSYNAVSWMEALPIAFMFGATGPNGIPVPGTYNKTIMEIFSYEAVMESFNKMLIGSIMNSNGIRFGSQVEYQAVNTSVVMTGLIDTNEMAFLSNFSGTGDAPSVAALPNGTWNGLSVSRVPKSTKSLIDALEEMFVNATISLMNSYLLQPNYSSPYAPPETLVTITPYYNIYVYSRTILWLSYGIGIALALLGLISGMLCAWADQGSYTTKFSTILRVARSVSLSTPIMMTDADGKDPTPTYIEKMVVLFPNEYNPVPVQEGDDVK